ncbi:MAG: hypothetical protein NT013_24445, partial [Planctomycetia bacterium]|nr:hypothetical protein [Planctomycetia bacterium]
NSPIVPAARSPEKPTPDDQNPTNSKKEDPKIPAPNQTPKVSAIGLTPIGSPTARRQRADAQRLDSGERLAAGEVSAIAVRRDDD